MDLILQCVDDHWQIVETCSLIESCEYILDEGEGMGVLTGWMQVRWIHILGLRSVRRGRLCVDGLVGLGDARCAPFDY